MYIYKKPPSPSSVSGPLPAGDYTFEVIKCDEPYQSRANNLVLPLRLSILPQGAPVFANPWAGKNKSGEERDGIAEFLLCVGRAPQEGQEPDWNSIVGARGRCRLKSEIAEQGKLAGQSVNVVAWFHRPQEIAQSDTKPKAPVLADVRGGSEVEPDDIPF